MEGAALPSRAVELVRSFLDARERLSFYLETVKKCEDDPEQEKLGTWITKLCTPTPEDVELLVADSSLYRAETAESSTSAAGDGTPLVEVYMQSELVRLLLYDDAFKGLRSRKLCLVDALKYHRSRPIASCRVDLAIQELLSNHSELSLEDQAQSFVLLVEDVPNRSASWKETQTQEWLDILAESLTSCPLVNRPQLLPAAATSGHTSLVMLLLDDMESASADTRALEAECLVQAVRNGHLELVRWLLQDGRFTRRNEGWHAVVRALEVSCASGSFDMTELLVPHYAPLCSSILACATLHPHLLRLALEHRHLDTAKLLLRCDPRGVIRHVDRLIAALQDSESEGKMSVLAAILVNQEEDENGWPVKWDATTLQQAISMDDSTFVRFLMSHVEFSQETLSAALETAEVDGKHDLIGAIYERLQASAASPALGDSHAPTFPPLIYADGDAVMAQKRGSLSFWPGIIHRCWLNGTYDVRFEAGRGGEGDADAEAPIEAELHPSAIRPRSSIELKSPHAVATRATERILFAAIHAVMNNEGDQAPSASNDKLDGGAAADTGPIMDSNKSCRAKESILVVAEGLNDTDLDGRLEELRKAATEAVTQIVNEGQQLVAGRETDASKSEVVNTHLDVIARVSDSTLSVVEYPNDGAGISLAISNDQSTPSAGTETDESPQTKTTAANASDPVTVDDVGADELSGVDLPTIDDAEDAAIDESQHTESPTADESRNTHEDMAERGTSSDTPANDAEAVEESTERKGGAELVTPKTPSPSESFTTTDKETSEKTNRPNPWRVPQPAVPSSLTSATRPIHPIVSCPVNWTLSTANAPTASALAFAAADQFREGDSVEVRYKGRADFFPGVIAFCHANGESYDVVYDNGEEEACVAWEYIRVPLTGQSVTDAAASSDGSMDVDPDTRAADEELLADISNLSSFTSGSSGFSLLAADLRLGQSSSEGPSTDSLERQYSQLHYGQQDDAEPGVDEQNSGTRSGESLSSAPGSSDSFPTTTIEISAEQCCTPVHSGSNTRSGEHEHDEQSDRGQVDEPPRSKIKLQDSLLNVDPDTSESATELVTITMHSPAPSPRSPVDQQRVEHTVAIDQLPEIPTILVPTHVKADSDSESLCDAGKELAGSVRQPSRTLQSQHQKARGNSSTSANPHGTRGRTANTVSSQELTEWRNVDLLFNRKRRLLQAQTGSVESTKLPWGEEFATIQSLKRFAAQHPDVLREHIEEQLSELRAPLASNSPGKKKQSSPVRCSSSHSGAGQARESLLLLKDLAFLLKHRLAPFFDAILPVLLPIVFNPEQRFLCETAYEVLEATVLHCSGRKLALLLLQLGETYSKHEDLRLLNLAAVYVEKCFRNWSTAEMLSLRPATTSATELLTLLSDLLGSKSASARISAQRSVAHLRKELGSRVFEAVVRCHVPPGAVELVLQQGLSPNDAVGSPSRKTPRSAQQQRARENPTIVHSSPSILQRMLLQRQNRVLPSQTWAPDQ